MPSRANNHLYDNVSPCHEKVKPETRNNPAFSCFNAGVPAIAERTANVVMQGRDVSRGIQLLDKREKNPLKSSAKLAEEDFFNRSLCLTITGQVNLASDTVEVVMPEDWASRGNPCVVAEEYAR